ncbi:MAG TPA: SDR family NAD(P)-dependent oxidoreductase [Labilithrix sp.]|jgi:3-oxoacyl-[acyl-carrier protein] reductase|nr:SDR family NAD(P)-dependent oxidoreductase [Labilithrix sp.]
MKGLDGKVALVTGGGKGLGRTLALALAARGVKVVVTGREERALGETVGEIAYGGGKARHLVGDVRDPAQLAAAVDRAVEVFGGLDIVVANAAASGRGALTDDLASAEAVLATNAMGVYYTFHAAARLMKGPGRLVVTSSSLATNPAASVAHQASKAAMVALVSATARELAPKKITCNAIVPGVEPDESVDLALFLCSSAGASITGQIISVGSSATEI